MVAKVQHKTRTGCPIACSLDIVGDHWTLLIVRNLMFLGIREYKDMLQTEEQISSSILARRLSKLERHGLIASIAHPDSKRRKLYYLTVRGKGLIHTLVELVLWAGTHLADDVKIPPEKRAMMESDVDLFVAQTLNDLEDWEKEHL